MEEHGHGRYSWAVLTSALLIALSMNLTLFSPGPVLNSIRQELHTSFGEIGLIFTVPAIILSLLTVIGGVLADSIGVRRVAGTGAVLLGLGGLLRGTAQDFLSFLLSTAIFAVGLGLALPNLPKAISGWFPESAVGSASGIYVLGFPLGATLASGATPYLAEAAHGWQGALVGWGLVTLVFAALWWMIVKEPKRSSSDASRSFRLPGSVLRNFPLWIIALSLFLNTTIFSIEVAWFPTVLAERGASAQMAGVMVSTFSLGNMAAVFTVPILSDKIGLRRPFLWAFAGVSALVIVSFIVTPPVAAWVILPVLGFAAAGPFAMGFLLPADFVDYSNLGSASGIVLSVGWLGIGSGSWLAGFLRDVSGSFYTTLIAIIICSLAIVALAFVLPETGRRGSARKVLESVRS